MNICKHSLATIILALPKEPSLYRRSLLTSTKRRVGQPAYIVAVRAARCHDGTEPPWLSKTPPNVFPVGAATISSFFNAPIILSFLLDRVDLLLLLSFCGTFILISPFLALQVMS